MEYLFVYGTLLRGEERDGFVVHLTVRAGTTRGRLWRAPAGYPVLQVDPEGLDIAGELLTIDDLKTLRVLDLLEGVADGLYSRIRVPVVSDGRTVEAWAYAMDASQLRRTHCTRLELRDWRAFRRRR